MIEFEIRDNASPVLEELLQAMAPERILQVAGKAVEVELRQHFLDRNSEGNKQGWPPNNFWNRIRNATALGEVTPIDATVVVADPAMNQKIYGGTITPKRCKYLALPASAQAYAAGSPREGGGPNLTFAFGFDSQRQVWRPALVAKYNYQRRAAKGKKAGQLVNAKATKATEGAGTVWYWLVASVTQDPDPDALPDRAVIDQKIGDALDAMLERLRSRSAA
jgi:hypothetical protein